jgi:uncharacterized protein YbjT (DUF2867 family)
MILVTGAAGKTGQALIRVLVSKNQAVRAFVRRPEQGAAVKAGGVSEVVVGDMADEGAYRRATEGVNALYHICPNMHSAEVELGQIAIAAAQTAGVTRFVYHSVLHPQTEKMPHHWRKLRVEELLFEAGLNFTILQPAAYMQNILVSWTDIVTQGVYRVPYPVETRLGMVDIGDVAEVAATVLTEAGHSGAIYELAGPEVLTQTEVAQILSEGLRLPVVAEQIPLESWAAGAKAAGLGEYQVETLLKMFRYYENYGFWGSSQVLTWLLGRPPTGFREFVERVSGK